MIVFLYLMVQRAGVHHGLGRVVAAEHHEQVAHHSSLLVVVQIYYVLRAIVSSG